MTKPQMVYQDINSITPYWNNPRVNDDAVEGLKKSIQEFNFLVPIVVDEEGIIVTGHTRHKASLELGLTEVPVIVAHHLNAEQIKAFRIADNRLSENAKWDEQRLSEELRQIQSMGFDMSSTGFSVDELDCLTGMISATCLNDLDYATVCGQVAPKAIQARDNVIISCGNYKFYVGIGVYKSWEADLLTQFPKRKDLITELATRLGFDVFPESQPVPEGTPETNAETNAEAPEVVMPDAATAEEELMHAGAQAEVEGLTE
jgi:hypothetical protein